MAIANKLGVDVSRLPAVATTPEAAMEKAVSIGTWAVVMGLPPHVGVVPPVTGRPLANQHGATMSIVDQIYRMSLTFTPLHLPRRSVSAADAKRAARV
jgi:hypothetical protein